MLCVQKDASMAQSVSNQYLSWQSDWPSGTPSPGVELIRIIPRNAAAVTKSYATDIQLCILHVSTKRAGVAQSV